ncbi:MAG: hypothetical protein ACREMY_24570, partial [bacterium]
SYPEDGGTWSTGSNSALFFELDGSKRPTSISFTGAPFLAPDKGLATQRITVFANDLRLGEVSLSSPAAGEITFAVPPSVELIDGDGLVIRFEHPDAASPAALGVSDTRLLAFRFRTFVMH